MFLKQKLSAFRFADGGEVPVESLGTAISGRIMPTPSVDALNRPIESLYEIMCDKKNAVIEMAAVSGIILIIRLTCLEEHLQNASLVYTAEAVR